MAYQVPRDLIEQARILLRKEAGLESYNPNDSSFPCLSTVEEVITEFDPSPESLRCKHCKGKLLRGSRSLICVYCGREQNRDTTPEPISFKSTIGFRWLVDSLGLDGSEIIDLSDDGTQSKREQYSVKNEIPLSNFLDLEMKWPDRSERFGLTDAEALENKEKYPFCLVGMDFNSSISEEKSDKSSIPSIEQSTSKEKTIEFEAFPVQENLDSFGILENPGGVIKPSEGKSADSWEADFQAASFVSVHEDVHSSHSSQIPSTNYASHMDPVFGPQKDVKEGKSGNDLFSHAPFSNKRDEPDSLGIFFSGVSVLEGKDGASDLKLSSVTANQSQHHGKALESVDHMRGIGDDSPDSDFKTAAYTESDHVTSSTVVSTRDGNCDSSDVWDDFTGSTESGEAQQKISSIRALEEDSFDAWNDFAASGTVSESQLANKGVSSAEEKSVSMGSDMFGHWNDVTSLTSAHGSQYEVSDEMSVRTEKVDHMGTVGLSNDLYSLAEQGDKLQNTGMASTADIMTKKGENAFDLWGDFTSSTGAQHNAGESNSVKSAHGQLNGEGEEVSDRWGNFTGLTNSGSSEQFIRTTEMHGDNSTSKEDDYAWDDFTSSVCGSEAKSASEDTARALNDISKPSTQNQSIHQQASEVEAVHEADDSSNSWSDFRSSSNAISGQTPSPVAASVNNTASENLSSQAWSDFPSPMVEAKQEHTSGKKVTENDTAKHDDLFDSWGSFSRPSVAQSNQSQNSEARILQADDFFGGWSSNHATSTSAVDNQLKIGETLAPDIRKTSEGEESYDAWSDFTSSTNLPSNQLHVMESHVDDNQAATQDDPFDSWNFLTSSSSSQSNNKNISSSEHFYTGMLNSSGVNTTFQPVLFSDVASNRNGSGNLGIPSAEVLDSFRAKDDKPKSDNPEQPQKDETVQTSGENPIDAETLISQMHDLSFMLESNLSIPKKVD